MRSWLRAATHEFRRADWQLGSHSHIRTEANVAASSPQFAAAAASPDLAASQLRRYYELDTSQLSGNPTVLRDRYRPLVADEETQAFLNSCKPNFFASILAMILRMFMSVTDTNGLLQRGSMFVLSRSHVEELLGPSLEAARAGSPAPLRLLDIGAGDGEVTEKLASLFDEVTVTEVSPWMARRLRAKGYVTRLVPFIGKEEFPDPAQFDVVAAMNLLDRCDHPGAMLRDSVRLMKPHTGRLLLAVVLPFSEFVEEGTKKRRVNGPLPMHGARCQDSASFEDSLSALVHRVLTPLNLEVERVAKVPYLCRGDSRRAYYTLADAILVLRHRDPEAGDLGPVSVPQATRNTRPASSDDQIARDLAAAADRDFGDDAGRAGAASEL